MKSSTLGAVYRITPGAVADDSNHGEAKIAGLTAEAGSATKAADVSSLTLPAGVAPAVADAKWGIIRMYAAMAIIFTHDLIAASEFRAAIPIQPHRWIKQNACGPVEDPMAEKKRRLSAKQPPHSLTAR